MFYNSMETLPVLKNGKSRAINWENRKGEKGKGGMAASELGPGRKGSPCIPKLTAGGTETLAEIEGPGVVQHIWITVTDRTSDRSRYVLRDLVLRMYWDGEAEPSVESPLGDFFCCGFGVSYPVNSMPVAVNPTRGFNCYFPMPFEKKAKITIENQNDEDVNAFFYQVDYCLYDELPANTGYFHAQWKRERLTEKGKDYVILDGVRGKGQYVGTYMALTTLERYWYGEGEIKFYLDGDEKYPTICGTGTEDYFGGAWSFATQEKGRTVENTYCTAFMGFPYYSNHDTFIHNDYHNDDQMPQRSFYRWHIMDPVLFEEDLKVTIQQIGVCHGGLFERQDDVATVAYWYQKEPHNPFGPLLKRKERWPR
ncbi:Protein of unknown function [Anaerocolumna xylanovorans DSM 12503]|uniref:DUF2961 domain-containing protein n=2 Tax=Anaerocolumna TaxID=1843210 RepID=A0A1M7YCJ7_9FIRM|nr:glycoside hydrolase family 172 protein [Anaerocolumna xylanovorans]SHO50357.1 Protein of unknown function [Anaerocolumna xylanovorans DSM 12503]